MKIFFLIPLIVLIFNTGCSNNSASPTQEGNNNEVQDTTTSDGRFNSVELIIEDMTLVHSPRPHGVPDSYDWCCHPEVRTQPDEVPSGWNSLTAWGQVYESIDGNPAINTRVELKDFETWILYKSGIWKRVQYSEDVDGAHYQEDFASDNSHPADIRNEPDGGVSVTAGDGFNFHFWPSTGRAIIDPINITGVWVTLKARLVIDDQNGSDDRNIASYTMNVGADWWRTKTAQWAPDFANNVEVGMGRFKLVKGEWQSYNMTTLDQDMLIDNPLPFR